MLVLGALISLITCAATSAMATNGEVDIGGPYYLMSRTLGPEFGGAIGLLFYIASSFAVARPEQNPRPALCGGALLTP